MIKLPPAIALTIAGSDPSGGAGIQADLKTFSAFGVYGASVITALTAQNTVGVTGVHKVPADFIRRQFDAVTSDLVVAAVKTGMLGDVETVLTVAALLRKSKLANVVVDPVMVATSGDRLLDDSAIVAVREALIPLANIITPNLPEAAALLELPEAVTEDQMIDHARRLLAFGPGAVLLKGGHGEGGEAVDILVSKTLKCVLRSRAFQPATRTGRAARSRLPSRAGWHAETRYRLRCSMRKTSFGRHWFPARTGGSGRAMARSTIWLLCTRMRLALEPADLLRLPIEHCCGAAPALHHCR